MLPSHPFSPSNVSESNPVKVHFIQDNFQNNPDSAIEVEIPLNNSESIKTKEELSH